MGPDVAIVLIACLMFVLLTGRVAADVTVRTLSGMFRAPDLGWPSGVQEDDDLRWTWAGASPGPGARPTSDLGPVLQELEPASPGLVMQPLRHDVRR